jgi:RNA polymerase sigma factor (sigma-70 family)
MLTDTELLRRYAQNGSEAAFGELVARHINLVYCTALRILGGDEHQARDVAQSVFTDLARKAASLCACDNKTALGGRSTINLTGWLYTGTRFAGAKLVRAEQIRRKHEQGAIAMSNMLESESAEPDWTAVRPVLDEALGLLDEDDRGALLMRFFEGKDLHTIGGVLGLSQDAARMRISRALEKLRNALAKRGVTTTAGALSVTLAAHAAETAPIGLGAAIASASLNAAVLTSSTSTIGILQIMASVKSKIALAALLAVVVATPIFIQQNTIRQLKVNNDALRTQLESNQAAQVSPQPSVLDSQEVSRARAQEAELLRLRGEVTRIRAEATRSTPPAAGPQPKAASRAETADTIGGYELFTGNLLSERHVNNVKTLKLLGVGLRRLAQNSTILPEVRAMSFSEDNQLRQELKQSVSLPDDEWNQIEILVPNLANLDPLLQNGSDPGVIIARAKESIQTPDGRWVRVYARADGSVVNLIHDSPGKAFDFGELENTVSAKSQ